MNVDQVRHSIKLHSYTYMNEQQQLMLVIKLFMRDEKGQMHLITSTETSVNESRQSN